MHSSIWIHIYVQILFFPISKFRNNYHCCWSSPLTLLLHFVCVITCRRSAGTCLKGSQVQVEAQTVCVAAQMSRPKHSSQRYANMLTCSLAIAFLFWPYRTIQYNINIKELNMCIIFMSNVMHIDKGNPLLCR